MVGVNLEDPAVLAREIKSGRIWSAPGWGIEMAIDAINEGKVPCPSYIPDEYRPLIEVDVPENDGFSESLSPRPPIDPLTGEPVVGIPAAVGSTETLSQNSQAPEPVDIEGALAAPEGGEALA